MKSDVIYGLVCAGGGAHGAYQVGVLKYIHEHFSNGDQSPFKIFTGCSCGSLNTSFYASQSHDAKAARLWLEELWLGFHVPGYHGNVFKTALKQMLKEMRKPKAERQESWSILDPKPMVDVINVGFIRKNLEKAMEEKTTLGIGVVATELLSGRCCWFVEGDNAQSWNLFHSIGKIDRVGTAHVAASCSVPIFMPPVKIRNRFFLDGSVSLDRPLAAARIMGATKVLSIATDKPFPDDLPYYKPNFQPRLSNVIRMLLNRLGTDTVRAEAAQMETFNRFYEALARKHRRTSEGKALPLFHEDSLPSHYQPMEVFQIHPSKRIRQASIDVDYGHGDIVSRKSTRFMFHRKFIAELIVLGYEDAKARHEELSLFFSDSKKKKWAIF